MKTLDSMVFKAFVPVFFTALIFAVVLLELLDLFANVWNYLENEVTAGQMLTAMLYYLPKCVSYSMPVALLFAVSFCLGTYHANNELMAVFGSGVSLIRFAAPFLLLGVLSSIFMFFFDDHVVISTFRTKNELSRQYRLETQTFSKSSPTVLDDQNRLIYHAVFYNDERQSLSELLIVEKDHQGNFLRRIDADSGEWDGEKWVLRGCRIFDFQEESGAVAETKMFLLEDPRYSAPPENFRETRREIEEMPIREAKVWVESLIRAGLPFRKPLTDYYRRYSFSLTPLIVVLLASSLGGRFKKNILLMSLFGSISLAVVYYVSQMVLASMAKNNYIAPLSAAWIPFIVFTVLGLFLFRLGHK